MVKKIFPWVLIILLSAFLIIGFAMKDKLNNYLSETMKSQASPEMEKSGSAYLDSAFNYTKNRLSYQFTFLEFGANCSSCKRMELVMEEIRAKYPHTVNVVFLNVTKPGSQILMKYFGIVSIPTQVLLNKTGKEFFRHTGYYSAEELVRNFNIEYPGAISNSRKMIGSVNLRIN
jgi:thiol:disulfide interchange protein